MLRVQDHDTAIDRLRHRHASMPERAELASKEQAITAIDDRLAALEIQLTELDRRQRVSEDELAALESRITEMEGRMYSGTVTSPRELQAMQADVQSLRRLGSKLEDDVLETMQEREPLDADLLRLVVERDELERQIADLRQRIDESAAAIDAELESELRGRASVAAGLPPGLVVQYEALRSRLGGVGVARLVHGSCGGCHLALPASELDALRHRAEDTVVRCEQCGRILVR